MNRLWLLVPILLLAALLLIGLREGRSAMGFWSANRASNPVGFWLGQVFIGLIMAALLAVLFVGKIQ